MREAPAVDHGVIQEAYVVGHEPVVRRGNRRPQSRDGIGDAQRIRIRGLRENAHAAVPGQRTGCPAMVDVARKPRLGRRIVGVVFVQQRDQYVDVQQRPQRSDTCTVADLVDQIVGHDRPARRGRSGLKPYRSRDGTAALLGVLACNASRTGRRPPVRPTCLLAPRASSLRPGHRRRYRSSCACFPRTGNDDTYSPPSLALPAQPAALMLPPQPPAGIGP